MKGDKLKLNPTCAGPSRHGNSHSNLERGYEARVERQQSASKGPGEDDSGGITFRLGWWAKPPSRMKPWESNPLSHASRLGYGVWAIRVTGGVAWIQWLTTLTGESPTSSAEGPLASRQ